MWSYFLVITFFTVVQSYTSYRYVDLSDSIVHRTVIPLPNFEYPYGTSNGRRSVESYSYGGRNSEVDLNGNFNQGRTFRDDKLDPVSTQVNQKSNDREHAYNSAAATERIMLMDQFADTHTETDQNNDWEAMLEEIIKRANATKEIFLNENSTRISKQLNDVNRKKSGNATMNNNKMDQSLLDEMSHDGNMSIKHDIHLHHEINMNNSVKNIQNTGKKEPINQSEGPYLADHTSTHLRNVDNKTQFNNFTFNYLNKDDRALNNTQHSTSKANDKKSETKTTNDNEVTPKIEERTVRTDDKDRWIWGVAENITVVPTTTEDPGLGDRAAFDGSDCPMGFIKVGVNCVEKDR